MMQTEEMNAKQKSLYQAWQDAGECFDIEPALAAAASKKAVAVLRASKSEKHEKVVREAHAVMRHLFNNHTLIARACKKCGRTFASNYMFVTYCSDECMADALESMGLHWNPEKSADERWGGEPPAIIEPSTLVTLKKWAQAIMALEPSDETPTEEPVVAKTLREEMAEQIAAWTPEQASNPFLDY